MIIGMKTIKLAKGQQALVDDADYDWLSQFHWTPYFDGYNWYANTSIKHRSIGMHRLLMAVQDGKSRVDHKDHNGLNNQRENLRVCTHRQNSQNMGLRRKLNRSGYKGVSWKPRIRKWVAQINVNGHVMHLGCFKDKRDAALAYDSSAIQHFGEFAATNDKLGLFGKPI